MKDWGVGRVTRPLSKHSCSFRLSWSEASLIFALPWLLTGDSGSAALVAVDIRPPFAVDLVCGIVWRLCRAGLVAAWYLWPWGWLAWLSKQQSHGVSLGHLNSLHLFSLSPCLFPYGAFNVYSTITLQAEKQHTLTEPLPAVALMPVVHACNVPTPVTQYGKQKKRTVKSSLQYKLWWSVRSVCFWISTSPTFWLFWQCMDVSLL